MEHHGAPPHDETSFSLKSCRTEVRSSYSHQERHPPPHDSDSNPGSNDACSVLYPWNISASPKNNLWWPIIKQVNLLLAMAFRAVSSHIANCCVSIILPYACLPITINQSPRQGMWFLCNQYVFCIRDVDPHLMISSLFWDKAWHQFF